MDIDWKGIVGGVAPTIATALGGPFAGMATKFLTGKLLGEGGTQEDLEVMLSNPAPETMVRLKELELEFKKFVKENEIKLEVEEIRDRQDARAKHGMSVIPAVLSFLLTVIIGVLLYTLFGMEVPEGNREILYAMLVIVIREWAGALHYWFGTTRSSSEKNFILNGRDKNGGA